jgi:hypothetical protein
VAAEPAPRTALPARDAPALGALLAVIASWLLALVAFSASSDAAGWSAIVLAGVALVLGTAGLLATRRGADRMLAVVSFAASLVMPVLAVAFFFLALHDLQIGA